MSDMLQGCTWHVVSGTFKRQGQNTTRKLKNIGQYNGRNKTINKRMDHKTKHGKLKIEQCQHY